MENKEKINNLVRVKKVSKRTIIESESNKQARGEKNVLREREKTTKVGYTIHLFL
jgi:hypothetical protein